MNWVLLAGALAAVLVLAGVAWTLRRGRDRTIETAEEAAQAAEAVLAGFRTTGAVVGVDGAAALAVDGTGRVAVCKRHGARIAVREVAWSAVRATAQGGTGRHGRTEVRRGDGGGGERARRPAVVAASDTGVGPGGGEAA